MSHKRLNISPHKSTTVVSYVYYFSVGKILQNRESVDRMDNCIDDIPFLNLLKSDGKLWYVLWKRDNDENAQFIKTFLEYLRLLQM